MFYLACTRFNNTTYDENMWYRNKYNENVIYGSTLKIREKYPSGGLIFIAEMNNEKNRIEGIGLIRNTLVHDKKYKIYDNDEYNRYIYRGKYWLSREQIIKFRPEILEVLDIVLFKGKSHLKCRIGITIITEKLFIRWKYEFSKLKQMVKEIFQRYCNDIDNELVEEDKLDEDTEEYFDIIPAKRKRNKSQKNNV